MGNFEIELRNLINRYSMENVSDTPDFILAEYLMGCLELFGSTVNKREKWWGRNDPWHTCLACPHKDKECSEPLSTDGVVEIQHDTHPQDTVLLDNDSNTLKDAYQFGFCCQSCQDSLNSITTQKPQDNDIKTNPGFIIEIDNLKMPLSLVEDLIKNSQKSQVK